MTCLLDYKCIILYNQILKLHVFEKSKRDLTVSFFFKALRLSPNDPKALFRRCQAYEHLDLFEDAYKDAALLIKVDPKNQAIKPIFNRLNTHMSEVWA